jgi:hypothetical protein
MRHTVSALIGGTAALICASAAQAATPPAVRPAIATVSAASVPLAGTRLGSGARAPAGTQNASSLQGGIGLGVILLAGVAAASAYGAFVLVRNHHGSTHNAHPVSPG